jgi:hypothetical protein
VSEQENVMSAALGALGLNLPPDVRPRLAPLEAWRRSLDSAGQAYAREVQETAGASLGAATRFDESWQAICREVLSGKAQEVHLVRDHFLGAFQYHLSVLSEVSDLVRFATSQARRDLPELDRLEEESQLLERKVKNLADRWRTAEDLEDLAAENLAPSPKTIEAVRQKHGYPQAWYDDNSAPF